jgi:hypothetical protein
MVELVDREGTLYRRVLVYAEPQAGGTWMAWLEFVSAKGDKVLQTDRETTQSTLAGVAYWAEGLEPVYFEGALDRAHRRTADPRRAVSSSPTSGGGVVEFRVRSADPEVPFRLMASRALVPGLRRAVQDGGVIVYLQTLEPALTHMPRIYEFMVRFGSENAAGVLALRLSTDLEATDAILEIGRVEVPILRTLIKEALLAASAT